LAVSEQAVPVRIPPEGELLLHACASAFRTLNTRTLHCAQQAMEASVKQKGAGIARTWSLSFISYQ